MQLPHIVTLVDPLEVEDQYGNPSPAADYGSGAPRRDVRGFMQPHTSTEPAETGRQPKITRWRLLTYSPAGGREQVEWRGRTFRVDGDPEMWEPARVQQRRPRATRPRCGCFPSSAPSPPSGKPQLCGNARAARPSRSARLNLLAVAELAGPDRTELA
ncbi:hypothetical protein ABZ345_47130 [Lentzea sp. NPDC005914]|uniref:hypothetical protein n=1 Tax=Lentzea sp. NPDC005914 TaxID=3154572 RepID=UPI0033F455AE